MGKKRGKEDAHTHAYACIRTKFEVNSFRRVTSVEDAREKHACSSHENESGR